MEYKLSNADVELYKKNGFVTPNIPVPESLLQKMKDAANNVLKMNPNKSPEALVNVHLEKNNPEKIKGDKNLLEICSHSFILDKVEQIIGRNIILWGVSLFCKPPKKGKAIPWHQDGYYWPIRPLATCTVWIALDEANIGNGCLKVIKGSHKKGILKHTTDNASKYALNQTLQKGVYDESQAYNIELNEGQLSLHDIYLVHGSNENKSDKRRAGLVIRYMPTSSIFDRTVKKVKGTKGDSAPNYAARPIFLVRGLDVSGKNKYIKYY